ncbi:hypothetical protein M0L20_25270 [Spirosoma sp. RP8]|uniref:TetR/AcrR family transcriptional regulator n=1 Tax=Spirosoma liriopis TaxID=2937440 RepID=A0ABT0HSQ7_9BACT|nr:hypothetical protein [Spirosoma liriopis]MCK8495206.1 hypothetical protein [Spirosoma liriopis]
MIISLYLELKRQAAAHINDALSAVKATKEVIKTYYVESLKWALHHPNEFSFLAQFSNSPYLKKIGAEQTSVQIEPVLQLFGAAIAEQQIADLDVALLYALISNQVFSVHQYLSATPFTRQQQHTIIENTFSMFWKID